MSYFVIKRRSCPNKTKVLRRTAVGTLSPPKSFSPAVSLLPVITPLLHPPPRSFPPPCRRLQTFQRHNFAAVPPFSTVHLYPPQETVFLRPRPSNSPPLSAVFLPPLTGRPATPISRLPASPDAPPLSFFSLFRPHLGSRSLAPFIAPPPATVRSPPCRLPTFTKIFESREPTQQNFSTHAAERLTRPQKSRPK